MPLVTRPDGIFTRPMPMRWRSTPTPTPVAAPSVPSFVSTLTSPPARWTPPVTAPGPTDIGRTLAQHGIVPTTPVPTAPTTTGRASPDVGRLTGPANPRTILQAPSVPTSVARAPGRSRFLLGG